MRISKFLENNVVLVFLSNSPKKLASAPAFTLRAALISKQPPNDPLADLVATIPVLPVLVARAALLVVVAEPLTLVEEDTLATEVFEAFVMGVLEAFTEVDVLDDLATDKLEVFATDVVALVIDVDVARAVDADFAVDVALMSE